VVFEELFGAEVDNRYYFAVYIEDHCHAAHFQQAYELATWPEKDFAAFLES